MDSIHLAEGWIREIEYLTVITGSTQLAPYMGPWYIPSLSGAHVCIEYPVSQILGASARFISDPNSLKSHGTTAVFMQVCCEMG
jgi:hypothetical protein